MTDPRTKRPRRPICAAKRPRGKNDPLTNAVLHTRLIVDPDEFPKMEDIEAQLDWLKPRIAVMATDRADELAQAPHRRDEHFLSMCGSKLAAMRNLEAALKGRRRALRHALVEVENKISRARRERRFIDAARDLLPTATFQALWDRVDRHEIEAAEIAA